MRRVGKRKGFTLVELSLSIAFISILSITVALIINEAISTYRRGLTLNQINTVGMDLVDDMRVAIQNSPSREVADMCSELGDNEVACRNEGGIDFVVTKKLAIVDGVDGDVPVYGAFCTGAYSYIWNSGYFDSKSVANGVQKAEFKYGDEDLDFKLLKVKDRNRDICRSRIGKENENKFAIANLSEEPEILLSGDTADALALYDLSVATPATNDLGKASFYSVSFILGTVQGGINVMSSGNFCKAPEEDDSNFDYCAINKFNFAAQATGGSV